MCGIFPPMAEGERRVAAVVGVGSVGAELVNQLVENGREVRALVRNPNKYHSKSPAVSVVKADITDDLSLIDAFEGVDEVYVTAADFTHGPNYGKGFERAKKVNQNGVTKVADAACIQGVKSIVLLSTEAVYGVQTNINEQSEAQSTGTYGATKRLGEIALFEHPSSAKRSVVRPVSILGPGADKWSDLLYNRVSQGKFMGIGDGSNIFSFVDIRDVAGAAIAITDSDDTDGQVYNLAADSAIRMNVLLELFSGLADRNPKYVPARLALAGALLAEIISARTGVHIPVDTQVVHTGLNKERHVSNAKIKEQLGFSFIPPEQTIYDSLAWINDTYKLRKEGYLSSFQPVQIKEYLE